MIPPMLAMGWFIYLIGDYLLEIRRRLRENKKINGANLMSQVAGCMSQVSDNWQLDGDSRTLRKLPTSRAGSTHDGE
jgi:hypothetical protein